MCQLMPRPAVAVAPVLPVADVYAIQCSCCGSEKLFRENYTAEVAYIKAISVGWRQLGGAAALNGGVYPPVWDLCPSCAEGLRRREQKGLL